MLPGRSVITIIIIIIILVILVIIIITGPNENSQKASKSTNNNDPDWVSNGKQTARKCFQEDRKIKRAHRLTSLHTIHRDGTKKKR